MKKLKSLSIFFPFYNDEATVERQVRAAYKVGRAVAREVEVIAIHGGSSRDNTLREIKRVKKIFPNLKIIDKTDNKEGYAVIKYGFYKASNDWVYYTDGDAQYHLEEDLPKLVTKQMMTGVGVVNGYKKKRSDNILRRVVGDAYRVLAKYLFHLPIRDIDCDSRLIKKSLLSQIKLESCDASILPELIKKLELRGAKFSEVSVSHFSRIYGESNYNVWSLFREKLVGDIKLYFYLRKGK